MSHDRSVEPGLGDLLPKGPTEGMTSGPSARKRGPAERTKLAIAVNDLGQAPKVEDLAVAEPPKL